MAIIWLIISLAGLSFLLTWQLREHAVKYNIVDRPRDRDSHSKPMPSGGGIGVVICYTLAIMFAWKYGLIHVKPAISLASAGIITALIGALDDYKPIKVKWRFLTHTVSAIMIVYSAGGLPPISFFGITINLGWIGAGLSIVAVVWILNLYNFMDGIDGIAGSEAIISTAVIGCFCYFIFDDSNAAILLWSLSASTLGFLCWNLPPAKIFMGNAASGYIGLMLGAWILLTSHIDQSLLWAWLIVLGVFITDSTYTLLNRLINGDMVYKAHKSHAYQLAAKQYNSHKVVTFGVASITLIWLTPIAYLVTAQHLDGFIGLIIAYLPLIALVRHYKKTLR